MTPAIGSRWRSKRNGRIRTVNQDGRDPDGNRVGVQLRFDNPRRLRWVALTPSGHPCGYEPAGDAKEGEG